MAMIGSFYAPGEWVQPNQRNIGDSLLDLYKMKREIENDRQAQEAAKMEMELKRMEMSRKVEEEKRQKEYVKQIGNLANQYQKTQALPEKVKVPAAPNLAAMFAGAAPGMMGAAGVMNRAMQGSFPQQFATPRMGAEELQRGAALAALQAGDPEKMSAALKLLSPTQTGRTFEEQSALNAQMHEFRLKEIQARGEETVEKLKLLDEQRRVTKMSDREYQTKRDEILHGYRMAVAKYNAESRQDLAEDKPYRYWKDERTGDIWERGPGGWRPAMVGGTAPAPGTTPAPAPGAVPAPMPPSLPPTGQAEPAPGDKVPSMAGAGAPSMDLPPMDNTKAAFEGGRLAGGPGAAPWTTPTGSEGAAPVAEPAPVNRPGQQFNVGKKLASEKDSRPAINALRQVFVKANPVAKVIDGAAQNMALVNKTYDEITSGEGVKTVAQLQLLWNTIKQLDDSVVRDSERQYFLLGIPVREKIENELSRWQSDPNAVSMMPDEYAKALMEAARRGYAATLDTYEMARRKHNSQFGKDYLAELGGDVENLIQPLPSDYRALLRETPQASTDQKIIGTVVGKDGKKYNVFQTPNGPMRSATPIEGGQ